VPDLGGLANRVKARFDRDNPGKDDKPEESKELEDAEVELEDDNEEDADESDVKELVETLKALVDSRRPPEGPIVDRWSLGVGDLLAEHPKVPKRLRGLIRRLDRFGGLEITHERIGFDGDDVKWSDVTEVRTRHMVDYLLGDAVQQQVENIPLPPFPGRRKLLDAMGKAMLTLTIATAEQELDDLGLDLRVPAEIEYKASFGRRKTIGAGVLAAVVLADPSVSRCVMATAQAKGIPVKSGDDAGFANAAERAEAIKLKVAALKVELDNFSKRFGRKEKEGADT
jgi:hypothetical protein